MDPNFTRLAESQHGLQNGRLCHVLKFPLFVQGLSREPSSSSLVSSPRRLGPEEAEGSGKGLVRLGTRMDAEKEIRRKQATEQMKTMESNLLLGLDTFTQSFGLSSLGLPTGPQAAKPKAAGQPIRGGVRQP